MVQINQPAWVAGTGGAVFSQLFGEAWRAVYAELFVKLADTQLGRIAAMIHDVVSLSISTTALGNVALGVIGGLCGLAVSNYVTKRRAARAQKSSPVSTQNKKPTFIQLDSWFPNPTVA